MSESSITEADQFIYLCSESIREGGFLESMEADYSMGPSYGDKSCTVLLTGVKPGRSAAVSWDKDLGFRVGVSMPDCYYSESSRRVISAEEAFALVSLLGSD